ncbi:MAG TPA: type VI secretion system tip protein TssI/VgrG, partial [Pirellulaceae bacterium]|nr:type VI secretion system tip protein TssI/VgrG [Pirellulaceae bacterium]
MNPFYLFPASNRPLRIETPLGADTFALLELTGHECLSELYEFRLRLAADRYTTIDFGKLLGKCVTLRINTKELGERIIHGMMCALSQLHNDDTLTHFDATIVPLFWLWDQRKQSRCFQQMSTPDILKAVFDGLDTKFLLSGQYLSRDYCVQYDETDFAFATRLMQEDGFFYYFEHRTDGHTLVITDDVANLAAPTVLDTVLFDADLGGTVDFPRVYKWSKSQQLVTTKFTCWDQCFE